MQREHLLSLPLKLHWAGWETTTTRLQQAGWSLSAEQFVDDWAYDGMRIAIRHEGAQMRGLTQRIPFEPAYQRQPHEYAQYVNNMTFPLQFMATRAHVQHAEMGRATAFRPIDAMPQFPEAMVIKDFDDYAHFATPLARTQEIILPDENVDELLGRILELQQPAKTEFFKRQLRENREGMRFDAIPRQKFHAQILSIAA